MQIVNPHLNWQFGQIWPEFHSRAQCRIIQLQLPCGIHRQICRLTLQPNPGMRAQTKWVQTMALALSTRATREKREMRLSKRENLWGKHLTPKLCPSPGDMAKIGWSRMAPG